MINRPLYVDRIMAYTDTPFVKVLTGVRRCGKSTVLKMIMEKLQKEHGEDLSAADPTPSVLAGTSREYVVAGVDVGL